MVSLQRLTYLLLARECTEPTCSRLVAAHDSIHDDATVNDPRDLAMFYAKVQQARDAIAPLSCSSVSTFNAQHPLLRVL
jgi:hypothetical protein